MGEIRALKDLLLKHYCMTMAGPEPLRAPIAGPYETQQAIGHGPLAMWARAAMIVPWSLVMRMGNVVADAFGGGIIEARRFRKSCTILIEFFVPERVVCELQGTIRRNMFVLETIVPRLLDRRERP